MPPVFEIKGLREFNRALKKVPGDMSKAVAQVNRSFAREIATDAKSRAVSHKGKSRFAGLIRYGASANIGTITYGLTRHPAAGGWIFGSYGGRRGRQFEQPWSGNQYTGQTGFGDFGPNSRAVSPAVKAAQPLLEVEYDRRIRDAFRAAFPGGR